MNSLLNFVTPVVAMASKVQILIFLSVLLPIVAAIPFLQPIEISTIFKLIFLSIF
jgi:hypothetical protein